MIRYREHIGKDEEVFFAEPILYYTYYSFSLFLRLCSRSQGYSGQFLLLLLSFIILHYADQEKKREKKCHFGHMEADTDSIVETVRVVTRRKQQKSDR